MGSLIWGLGLRKTQSGVSVWSSAWAAQFQDSLWGSLVWVCDMGLECRSFGLRLEV